MTRAERRALRAKHQARAARAARDNTRCSYQLCDNPIRPYHFRDQYIANAIKFSKTKQVCSCCGCGNQRRWEGPTIQERRAEI